MIKDSINIYKNYSNLKSNCLSCKEIKHDFFNCPLLFNQFNNSRIIKEFITKTTQERKEFTRFLYKRKKIQNLNDITIMRESIILTEIPKLSKKKVLKIIKCFCYLKIKILYN